MTAVMVKTRTKGTMVVNQESEEIWGISWGRGRGSQGTPDPSRARGGEGRAGGPRLPPQNYLQDEEEEEIGVGHFLELLEEVDGQEGDDVVLGGLDAVVLGTRRGGQEPPRPRDPPAPLGEGAQGCRSPPPQFGSPDPLESRFLPLGPQFVTGTPPSAPQGETPDPMCPPQPEITSVWKGESKASAAPPEAR